MRTDIDWHTGTKPRSGDRAIPRVERTLVERSSFLQSVFMKSHTEYLTFTVPARMGFVNITAQCEDAVRKSGVREGLLLANATRIYF